jgi:hemolysin activation/secretion protein
LLENFDILLPNNNIQVTTSNYGKGNDFNANLLYTNNFFNKNWNFTASFDYIYSDSKGYYNDYNMSFSNNSYSFKLKNQILLSQSKNLNMSFVYGYKSSNKTIYGNLNNLHSLELEFTKSYKDFNFSLNAFDILRTDLKISESKEMYNFYKKIDYFKNYSIGIRYNFGNNKVKKIEEKKSEINKRLL